MQCVTNCSHFFITHAYNAMACWIINFKYRMQEIADVVNIIYYACGSCSRTAISILMQPTAIRILNVQMFEPIEHYEKIECKTEWKMLLEKRNECKCKHVTKKKTNRPESDSTEFNDKYNRKTRKLRTQLFFKGVNTNRFPAWDYFKLNFNHFYRSERRDPKNAEKHHWRLEILQYIAHYCLLSQIKENALRTNRSCRCRERICFKQLKKSWTDEPKAQSEEVGCSRK